MLPVHKNVFAFFTSPQVQRLRTTGLESFWNLQKMWQVF